MDNPFMALSFLALPVIPALKLTDLGLVDVNAFSFLPLFNGGLAPPGGIVHPVSPSSMKGCAGGKRVLNSVVGD